MESNDTHRNMSFQLFAALGVLLYLGASSWSLCYAQETGGAPKIDGPYGSDPVAPVEMGIDLSQVPIEVPLQVESGEVPLQEPKFPDEPPSATAERPSALQTVVPQAVLDAVTEIPPEFSMPNPNFDGIKLGDAGAIFVPPDTNGDVGPNHYVQTVNSSIAIFDKEGTTLVGPIQINTLFAPLGGPCATGAVIDPIVNYDPLADRWVVMGFPFTSPLCIAVSRTDDPVAGGWFLYAFDLGVSIPDYPKLGVWPDAYYLGLNAFSNNVCALDRTNMLSGNPATFVCFGIGGGPFPFPADLDGPPPSIGAPAPFVRQLDGEIWGGVDRLEVFEFRVDFRNPASSVFNFVVGLPTDPFSADLCGSAFFGNCAEQPGGALLETLPFFLMWRLQYRNFGTHETLVANHTIDVDPMLDEQAGIRWYELRRSDGGTWTIFQEGDFAPQDPVASAFLHRWMGSIAMDKEGNISLGFSASSRDVFPSVRYVGRRVTDPLGSLPQGDPPDGDLVMVPGEGSQFASRWGDYSAMSIDPVDGCTFWYTQEYVGANGAWRTRIGAFGFPSCQRIIIDGCDTGVEDQVLNGLSISEKIVRCGEGARNHGKFVSCVAHLTNDLKKAGIINGKEKGAIQSCAAQADIP